MKNKTGVLVIPLIISVCLLGFYQTIRYVLLTPAGSFYPLVHNYEQDYYWYLSMMRQGWDGTLLLSTKYTAEQFAGIFVNTFFPFFGMVSRLLSLPLPVMYTILRFLGAFTLLWAFYLLTGKIFSSKLTRWLAILLAFCQTPLMVKSQGNLVMAGEFWTGFDPIFRIAWLPHHTIANAVAVTLFIVHRSSFIGRKNIFILITLLSFLTGWLNPASGLLVLFVFAGLVIAGRKKAVVTGDLSVLTGAGVSLVSLFFIQGTTFPWTAFRDWEKYNQYPVNPGTYLVILGLPGFLALGGIVRTIITKNLNLLLVILWYLFPFLGLLIFSQTDEISNGRFLQSAGYLPAAILSAYFLEWGISRFKRKAQQFVYLGIVILIAVMAFPAFARSLKIQEYYISKNLFNNLVIIPDTTLAVIEDVGRLKPGGLVIAPENISLLIPAFTRHRVYAGHPTFTYNPPGRSKSAELAAFLYGTDELYRHKLLVTEDPLAVITDTQKPDQALSAAGYRVIYRTGNLSVWTR
jgi:hypothetical protein